MNTLFEMDILDTVIHGDALEVLKSFPDECVHAICCDPPAGINFMNKDFDKDRGGRTHWVAWLSDIMREARRVLKNGGHALVWSLPRTSHWTALALEDAGFEIRDQIYNLVSGDTLLLNFIQSLSEEQQHAFMQVLDGQREPSGILQIFGQGFPKSANISKLIDRMKGMEREVIGTVKKTSYSTPGTHDGWKRPSHNTDASPEERNRMHITKPATPESEAWEGWGSNLKPAVENWILVRKPLAASSIAENVLEYGTGGINIDAIRIKHNEQCKTMKAQDSIDSIYQQSGRYEETLELKPSGRFPSHLLLSHTLFCYQSGTKKVHGDGHKTQNPRINKEDSYGFTSPHIGGRHNDEDGMETVTNWICDESCPVRILDEQSGIKRNGGPKIGGGWQSQYIGGKVMQAVESNDYKDQGGASRYFQQLPALDDIPPYIYAGKASRRDRTADNAVINTHPTVKSLNLSKYLVRLITPPNGIILDCFAGSGSTLVAAIHEGFHFIGVERELEYITIARARIEHALATVGIVQPAPDIPLATPIAAKTKKTRNTPHSSQLSLWDKEQAI